MTETLHQPECDIVMRGGITSGLVYPAALVTLAEHWRFRNIGGASAGALAAGMLAAAEYGRRSGHNPNAYQDIAAIPRELGGGRLRRLFTANTGLEDVMALVWQWFDARANGATLSRFLLFKLGSIARMPLIAALTMGAMILLLGWSFGLLGASAGWALLLVLLSFALLMGAELLALWRAGVAAHAALLAHGLGLSSGTRQDWPSGQATLAQMKSEGSFSEWIHAAIQNAAGRTDGDLPLTMADLWTADGEAGPADAWHEYRAIDLLLTTTNLSQAIPASFPFLERSSTRLMFLAADLRRVLPAAIVDHLLNRSDRRFDRIIGDDHYRRLPLPQDLPVTLGVRLSLSFPGMISAVRMFVDRGGDSSEPDALPPQPVWFSDGGITSNFPVTVFDTPLPTRPTFCINLGDRAEAQWGSNADPEIGLPQDNSDGLQIPFQARPDAGILRFLAAIIGAARNGRENELMAMAGQRDRIVNILLDPKTQGGLCFDMDDATIAKLDTAGRRAAEALNLRFTAPGKGWANHRWVRLRTSLAAFEQLAIGHARGWREQDWTGLSFAEHEAKMTVSKAPAYKFSSKMTHERALHWATRVADTCHAFELAQPGWPEASIMNSNRKSGDALARDDRAAPRPGARFMLQANQGRDPLKG